MKIIEAIKKYPKIKNEMPFLFSNLVLFVRKILDNKKITSSAIRNIMLSDYYDLGYKNIERNIYLKGKINEKVLSKFSLEKTSIVTKWSYSLMKEYNLTNQMFVKRKFAFFGDFDEEVFEILDKIKEIEYKKIPLPKYIYFPKQNNKIIKNLHLIFSKENLINAKLIEYKKISIFEHNIFELILVRKEINKIIKKENELLAKSFKMKQNNINLKQYYFDNDVYENTSEYLTNLEEMMIQFGIKISKFKKYE